mgnify:CR=1 FL=1
MKIKKRLDVLLVERLYADSRTKAQAKSTDGIAVESSLAMYGSYAFYADCGGVLRCVDTTTMTTAWAVDTGDSVRAAIALDLEEGNLEALSRIATTYVADHDFRTALDYANRVLDLDEHHASSLATAAICHGLLEDPVLCKYYTEQAVENGYSKTKIEDTISTLKKRVK